MKLNRTTFRAVEILKLLAASPDGMTLSEIGEALNLPKTSAFDIVRTLNKMHFLHESKKRFTIGFMAHEVGVAYDQHRDLYGLTKSHLTALADSMNMAGSLVQMDGGGLDYVIETPVVAVVFFLFLLAGYFILAFWGSTMEGKKGRLYLVFTGLCMLLYTAGFLGALLFAMHRINQPLTGASSIIYTVEVDIIMYFSRAYFVAIGAGILCMASALIHGLFNIRLTGS